MTDGQHPELERIPTVARGLGLGEDEIEVYGRFKAKVPLEVVLRQAERPDGKLILERHSFL